MSVVAFLAILGPTADRVSSVSGCLFDI